MVARSVAVLDDGTELPFELFLGVPKHRAPDVVIASSMTEDGYVPVDSATLKIRYPGVYAIGDVATAGVPKAGVFAAPATSSSAADSSGGWTSTSSPAPRRPGPSTRRPGRLSPRRSTLAPAAASAGSAAETGLLVSCAGRAPGSRPCRSPAAR